MKTRSKCGCPDCEGDSFYPCDQAGVVESLRADLNATSANLKLAQQRLAMFEQQNNPLRTLIDDRERMIRKLQGVKP